MATFKKSLSEDSVDYFSHTWAFLFLLLLSLSCLLVSLSPPRKSTQSQASSFRSFEPPRTSVSNFEGRRYKAVCWTPSQFTSSHVDYTNEVCAMALSEFDSGRNFSMASVYYLPMDQPIPTDSEERNFYNRPPRPQVNSQEKAGAHAHQIPTSVRMFRSDFDDFTRYKAPLYLFLFAVALRLPVLIHSVLSLCFGCLNVDKTLENAQNATSRDHGSQMGQIATKCEKRSQRSLGLLYLLMKVLMVIVTCVELGVTSNSLLGETRKLENDLDRVTNEINMERNANLDHWSEPGGKVQTGNKEMSSSMPDKDLASDGQLLCDFKIRFLTNLRHYTIQCVFFAENPTQGFYRDVDSNSPEEPGQGKQLLSFKAIFTIVWALLAVLVIGNILSLAGWLTRLLLPSCRRNLGLKPGASLDAVFLASMAHYNTSITSLASAMDPAQRSALSDDHGNDQGEAYSLTEKHD